MVYKLEGIYKYINTPISYRNNSTRIYQVNSFILKEKENPHLLSVFGMRKS